MEHGFWDGEPDVRTVYSLIHSEWSEALEEARNGRPLVWHQCSRYDDQIDPCEDPFNSRCWYHVNNIKCCHKGDKPEGIAVELIDGVIRICDLYGYYGLATANQDTEELMARVRTVYPGITKDLPVQHLINSVHIDTSVASALMMKKLPTLEVAVGKVFVWIEAQGLNPEEILREKMQYNKTRPYKHGKQF